MCSYAVSIALDIINGEHTKCDSRLDKKPAWSEQNVEVFTIVFSLDTDHLVLVFNNSLSAWTSENYLWIKYFTVMVPDKQPIGARRQALESGNKARMEGSRLRFLKQCAISFQK